MTQILLFILVVGIGLFYALKYRNKVKKDIAEFENKRQNKAVIQEIVELKYFGKINLNKTEEYISVVENINDNKIPIDLNIVEEKISYNVIQPTIKFLKKLSEIEKIAHKKIFFDYKNGNVVKDYIEHHISEFTENQLKSIGISANDDDEVKKDKFLNKFYLKRISFYPESWDSMVVFDYTINDDFTQYLIVVSFDSNGKFVAIYTES